jgi:hypothetical protein
VTTKTEGAIRRGLRRRGRARSFIPGCFEKGRLEHRPVECRADEIETCRKCPICKIGQIEATGAAMRVCNYCGQRYSVREEGGHRGEE